MKYFLHDSNAFHDEKLTRLYMEFGYEGLGLFYTILERLAFAEEPINKEVLQNQLNVGKKLKKCWDFMESLEIISTKDGETFNKNLLKFSEKYLIKKEKNKIKVAKWRQKRTESEDVTGYVPVRNRPKDKISISKGNNKISTTKRSTSGAAKKAASIHNDLIAVFVKAFKEKKGFAYPFENAKDGAAMKSLIAKIKKQHKATHGVLPTDGQIKVNFEWMLKNLTPFVEEHFKISIVNNQFIDILTHGKNGKEKQDGVAPGIRGAVDIIKERDKVRRANSADN